MGKAVELLSNVDSHTDGYEFDLMDITRQYLSNFAYSIYKKAMQSFSDKNKEDLEKYSEQFLTLLLDVDRLLRHRDEYSFEKWIVDAKKCAESVEEQDLFEYNATALVTVWGNEEASTIFDYSWREWSGLIEQFYVMRWKFFFGKLSKFLESDTEYSEEGLPMAYGREAWRANALYSEMADKELEWIHSKKKFDPVDVGELKMYVKTMLNKYPVVSQ